MTYQPKLIGRTFSTVMEVEAQPVWGPLESVARLARSRPDLPSFHEGEFMFMSTARNARKKLAIHLYKHVDTRRYLNLDDAGEAYAYRGSPGDRHAGLSALYRRYRTLADALEHVQIWLFDSEPAFFRSFPPSRWPPDHAEARPRAIT